MSSEPAGPGTHPLATLFRPRTVALVGATEKSLWTRVLLEAMKGYGGQARAYAVNRGGVPVFGLPGFGSCAEIPEPVDAVFVSVPLASIPEAMEDVARAGIRAAVVLTSGFGEVGAEGRDRQDALLAQAARHGIRVFGPNSMGFANISAGAALTAVAPRGPVLGGGRVAFVSQSGATASEILEFATLQGVAISFFAATGNEAQISVADVVDFLVDDAATRVVMIFAETIRNADRFAAAARRALSAGKPIVILKVGTSEISASVARAHTGSLVGDDRVFDAACRQLGVIRVRSLEDLVVTAGLLAQTGPLPPGGVGVASISGGACTLIADQAEAAGLPLPPFAAATVEALRQVLPGYASTLNPLDVTGGAVTDPTLFEKVLEIIGRDPGIAVRVCALNLPQNEDMKTPTPAMLASVGKGLRAGGSPGLLAIQSLKPLTDHGRRCMREAGIPAVSGGLDHAVRAIGRALWWSASQRSPRPAPPAEGTRGDASLRPGADSEVQVLACLERNGVPVIPRQLTRSADEAIAYAEGIGEPIVLKICSPDIAHKTEAGGVRLRLEGADAIAAAWSGIDAAVRRAHPAARIDGILAAPMRTRGVELFIGTARDPDWGAVIAVGLGGIWVELLRDTAVRLLPVTRADVLEMLGSLRGAAILRGFRGSPAADLDALADAVVRIGTVALALGPGLAALEVNPLLVDGARIEALDGLVTWT